MGISFVVTALQLFIIVPGIFLATYLAFVSPSEMVDTLISLDQNVRAKLSKNILHIGIITVISFVVYFAFGGVLILDSPSWFKSEECRTISIILLFHVVMSFILLFLLYYIYRNQRLRFLLKGFKGVTVKAEKEVLVDEKGKKDKKTIKNLEKRKTKKPPKKIQIKEK
jgi:hypothetical protein